MASKGQKFSEKYSEKWPWVSKCLMGSEYARCNTCQYDFSIKVLNMVEHMIFRNIAILQKHKLNVECLQGVSKLESFVNVPQNSLQKKFKIRR